MKKLICIVLILFTLTPLFALTSITISATPTNFTRVLAFYRARHNPPQQDGESDVAFVKRSVIEDIWQLVLDNEKIQKAQVYDQQRQAILQAPTTEQAQLQ